MSKLTDRVSALVQPVVEEEGCSLGAVEYVREAGQWFLRVYVDKDGGVSINDCEALSKALDPVLDEADPIPDSYVFEVSSAGAERELRRPSDFVQFMGHEVEVRLYRPLDGKKSYVGELCGYEDGKLSLSVGGETLSFEKPQIAKVNLHVSF